jgi:5-formyltetrahydrofolate cyclo-ligase
VLVPLLAFDGEGYRLGYGGGYYDRAIANLRRSPAPPLFIGVAYSMQEIEQVPTNENDLPLDGILTELGVSMF